MALLTAAQLATKHGVHKTMISAWKRQAMEGLTTALSGNLEAKEGVWDGEVEKLHAKISQPVVEREFSRKRSGDQGVWRNCSSSRRIIAHGRWCGF